MRENGPWGRKTLMKGSIKCRLAVWTLVIWALVMFRPAAADATTGDDGWGPGTFMIQSIGAVLQGALAIGDGSAIGFDDEAHCLFGAYVANGSSIAVTRVLQAGKTYVFLGGGDDDVADLDIEVRNEAGRVVAKDDDDDNTPIVLYSPEGTAKFSIQLSLYKSRTSSSFVSLAIMRKGGYDIPVVHLRDAVAQCFAMCERAHAALGGVRFHDRQNQWALVGGVLEQGETVSLGNMALEEARHAFVTAGDRDALDLDMTLVDQATGKIVDRDVEGDSKPVIVYTTRPTTSYKLGVVNVRSSGPAMVVTAILETLSYR